MKNWNCDNDKCKDPNGEVRILPIGGDGNLILCRVCYEHEMAFRKDRNRQLASQNQFDLPAWEDLSVYET